MVYPTDLVDDLSLAVAAHDLAEVREVHYANASDGGVR